ncbi:MAG: anti-sigma factor antagonist [Chitinophagaceae bacterium]|nr:MAG: anti-sigma factor antagonist [Chitinophagaceae bacterium]
MNDSTVIRMPRRFDYSANDEFMGGLTSALGNQKDGNNVITLDCSQMDYIDSAGIGLLVLSHKKAEQEDSKICLTNLKESAREILYLANIQQLIEFK